METLSDELKAIWLNPEAQEPRLAAAERMETRDPARAQFIRDQILQTSSSDSTADCFEKSGPAWLRALLEPLGLQLDRLYLQHYSPSWRACAQGHVTVKLWEDDRQVAALSPVCWERGFVSCLELRAANHRMNMQQALRVEPIDKLHLSWNSELESADRSRDRSVPPAQPGFPRRRGERLLQPF